MESNRSEAIVLIFQRSISCNCRLGEHATISGKIVETKGCFVIWKMVQQLLGAIEFSKPHSF